MHQITVALQLAGDRARRQRDGIRQHDAVAQFQQPAVKADELRLRLKVLVKNHLDDRDIRFKDFAQQHRAVTDGRRNSADKPHFLPEAVPRKSAAERIQHAGEHQTKYADFRGPLSV